MYVDYACSHVWVYMCVHAMVARGQPDILQSAIYLL